MDSGGKWFLALQTPEDVTRARAVATRAMESIGASVLKKTRFVTAVSEIARNTVQHGGGGTAEFMTDHLRGERAIIAVFRDTGPGIEDIERALSDRYSTAGGMGLGLGGAKRLSDLFNITSTPGDGCEVRLGSTAI